MAKKLVALECIAEQTLAKDHTGMKVKLKEGDVFKTDSATADTYLRVYGGIFKLAEVEVEAGGSEASVTIQKDLDAANQALESEKKKTESLEAQLQELKLEGFRVKYEGVDLKDIPYNDLLAIAKLKGHEFKKQPSGKDLLKVMEDAEAADAPDTAEEKAPKTAAKKK